MATKDRDAIFELVVLKEKGAEEKSLAGGEGGHENTTASSHGEASDSRTGQGSGEEAGGAVTTQTNRQEEEQRAVSGLSSGHGTANGAIDSFDNATYSSTYFGTSAKKQTPKEEKSSLHTLSDIKWLLVVFLFILIIALIIGVIAGLSLALINGTDLSELQQTAVDNTSFQLVNAGILEMFSSLQTQMAQLNESVRKLRENLSQISLQLNGTELELTKRIDSIKVETEALTGATELLNLTLSNQSSRISALEMNFDLRLTTLESELNDSLGKVRNDVGTLRMQVSSPVDVFGSCEAVTINATTLSLPSNNDFMSTASTVPVHAVSNNETYIADVHCQIPTRNNSDTIIEFTHLKLAPDGKMFCQCTALQPLSSNGTHSSSESDVDFVVCCQMVLTRCSRQQQLVQQNS